MELAPDPPFGVAVPASVSLTLTLDLDAGAVDQQMQWPFGGEVGRVHRQGLLEAEQRVEVGHRPVQPDQPQQASTNPVVCLSAIPNEHLRGQARLDGNIAVALLSAMPTCR